MKQYGPRSEKWQGTCRRTNLEKEKRKAGKKAARREGKREAAGG